MERVAGHLANMKGGGRYQVAQVCWADLHHEIWLSHLSPVFRFDQVAFELPVHPRQSIHHQKVRADVCAVPIVFVRKENDPRFAGLEDVSNDLNASPPVFGIMVASVWADALQSVRSSR